MGDIERIRVLVVGDSGVGKTSLTWLLSHDTTLPNPSWTVGCSIEVKLHEFQEGTQQQKSFFVELWDVGGSHSQRNTRHVFFHTVHGIILVHDLANRKSCHNLGRWLAEVTRAESGSGKPVGESWDGNNISVTDIGEVQIPLLVVGTKADVMSERSIPTHMRRSDIAEELGTEEIHLNCNDPSSLAAGSSAATKLSRFFDKVIERQFFGRSGSSVLNHQYDRRRVDKSPHLGPAVYNDKRNPVILGGLG